MTRLTAISVALGVALFAAPAWAADADDLQRLIDDIRKDVRRLEKMDKHRATEQERAILVTWSDAAFTLRSEGEYEKARAVIDRCRAQADMIDAKISAAEEIAEAEGKEGELKRVREENAKLREAIQAATLQKAGLEAKSK